MRSARAVLALTSAAMLFQAAPAAAQQPAGAAPAESANAVAPAQGGRRLAGVLSAGLPTADGPPPGMQPLAVDLFTSKNFYQQQDLWLDQRYYRCNAPRQVADMWSSGRIGDSPPTSAGWGVCTYGEPRESIVSPYPHKTAADHYAALMAAARAKGGPTSYTKANVPDWDGYYARDNQAERQGQWIWGTVTQAPTILSLLTPEYRRRMVQMAYHEGVNNAPQWNASFCYPEGFPRIWAQASQASNFQLTMTNYRVQFLGGIAANFLRQVEIGKQHVQKVPQWYGETVGFWDGETLVAWTANVQAWTLSHVMFETSGKMETVETFTPVKDAAGQFVGLDHETIFYDPEAFVEPVRAKFRYVRQALPSDPERRNTYIECLSNIKNTDGRPRQLSTDDPRFIDYYGRPWAKNWEQYFEQGWDKPEIVNVPDDVLELLR
jgi:hypothetical protein